MDFDLPLLFLLSIVQLVGRATPADELLDPLFVQLFDLLLGLEELLLDQRGNLGHELLLHMPFSLLEDLPERDELAVADEGCESHLEVLGVEEGALVVVVGDGDCDFVEADVAEEHWELNHRPVDDLDVALLRLRVRVLVQSVFFGVGNDEGLGSGLFLWPRDLRLLLSVL